MMQIASHVVAGWAHLYSDNRAVSSTVTYVHLAGVLLGGGVAVAADRAVIAAPDPREGSVAVAAVHRWVLVGLVIIVTSGVFMMLADLHTYLTSAVFWTKMALTVLLLGNGYLRLQAERAVVRGVARAWQRLRGTSIASLVLWFVILLAGTILGTS